MGGMFPDLSLRLLHWTLFFFGVAFGVEVWMEVGDMRAMCNVGFLLEQPTTITREITQASASTTRTRGHFGCIFTAIADCAA
jgi:hypothetical protein